MWQKEPADKQKNNVDHVVEVASMVIWRLDQRHDRPWSATSNKFHKFHTESEDLDDLISSKVLPFGGTYPQYLEGECKISHLLPTWACW